AATAASGWRPGTAVRPASPRDAAILAVQEHRPAADLDGRGALAHQQPPAGAWAAAASAAAAQQRASRCRRCGLRRRGARGRRGRLGRRRWRKPVAAAGDPGAAQDPVGHGRRLPGRHPQGPTLGRGLQEAGRGGVQAERQEVQGEVRERSQVLQAHQGQPRRPQRRQDVPLLPAARGDEQHVRCDGGSDATAVRPLAEPPPVGAAAAATAGLPTPVVVGNLSFSTSNTEEYSDEDDSDDEGTDDMGGGADERGKRKRTSEGGAAAGSGGEAGSGKMMRFFEGLMKQVMERQEAMQQRFLEAIEKREKDRMIREEAWRRQEMARLAREQEILGQERAMAATRDAAVLSFIQKITGQTVPMPSIAAQAITFMPPPPPSQPHATPIAYSAAPVHPRPSSSQPPATHSPPQPQPSPRQQKPPTMPPVTPQPHKSPALATPQLQQQAPATRRGTTDPVAAADRHRRGGPRRRCTR
uniref:Uncharacterized protein n=1 Tax=Aegilops tauschii subsp. strangulata TaxID=200361 RepID=A0A452YIX2_AEGTS